MSYREPKLIARQVDAEARKWRLRNRKGGFTEVPYGRFHYLGKRDIADLDNTKPWQKTVLDELGEAHPVNKGYTCPKCGRYHHVAIPPERCFFCKEPSPISRLNMRR